MEKLTIKDIAKMAGVSHTTVSRALNGAQNIRPETYARIMELCRTTGYTPNAAARQLKRSDSGAIGIIVPDISNAFFCELTRHLEWMARQEGRNVFISSSFYDYEIEDRNIRALMENRVSGIILSGVGDQTYLHLRDYLGKVPIVFLGDNIPEGMVSQITVNNYEGTRMGHPVPHLPGPPGADVPGRAGFLRDPPPPAPGISGCGGRGSECPL